MVLFLGSWAMLFAALFFAYGVLRVRATSWPPADAQRLPLLLPGLNTLLIAASSLLLQGALLAAREGRGAALRRGLAAALALGTAFLALQGLLWWRLWAAGLRPGGGPYPSVFYTLTVFHALHVAVGLLGLTWAAMRAGAFGPARHLGLRLWTAYWHFVGAVWVLLYLAVFVL
jgi:cytochrome c oxidase subunit 3